MSKLIISIVNFNAGEYLINCLESLEKVKKELPFEVWVIDNDSTDGSMERAKKAFPSVNFIENKANLGFGKANNLVLRKKADYYLILNPDSKVLPGVISYMVNFMKAHPDVGVASCRVEKADGSLDWASHRGFPTPLASFRYFFLKDDSLYHLTKKDMSVPHEVDSIVGAFMMLRKEAIKKAGLFDEDFFLYGEDLDLCYRIKKAGYKVMYVPQVKIIHLKGISSGIKGHTREISPASKESRQKSLNFFYSTMILFYRKNLASKYPFLVNWLVYFGIYLKWWLAKRKMTV